MTGFYKDYADSSDTHQNSAEASADAAESAKLIAQSAASTATTKAVEATNAAGQAAASLAAQEDLEVTSASFDTTDGTLTLTKANSGTVTTDLDGRYLTAHQDITGKADLSGADFTGDVTTTGYVGIGTTTPHSLLTVHNGDTDYRIDVDTFINNGTFIASYNPDLNTYGSILTRASTHRWGIGTDEKMRIDDTGYVGINNNNPSEALDVGGNSVVSGDATVGGELTVTGNAEAELFKGDLEGAVHFKGAVASGATLTKGDVVYVSGYSGGKTEVDLADASDSSKMPAFGIVAADPVGVNVDVVTFGTLKTIDTSSYTDGDELFVDTTAGGLTATAPSGEGNLVQKIAKVVRADNSGNIKVMGAGRTNATPNLNDGNIFIGDSNNQAVTASLATQVSTLETSHDDVLVDGDFTSNGFMKRDGAGVYSVDANTYLTTHQDISGKADLSGATFTGSVNIGIPPNGTETLNVAGSTELYSGLDLNFTDITGVDTLTAKNVDISTTGGVTTNIASGSNTASTDIKTVNIGTGFANGGTTHINIGAINAATTCTTNVNNAFNVNGVADFNSNVEFNSNASTTQIYDQLVSFKAKSGVGTWSEAGRVAVKGYSSAPASFVIGVDQAALRYFDGFGSRYITPANADTANGTDAVCDLGTYYNRFRIGKFSSGTSTTSDGREKRNIEELNEAELRVATRCKSLLRKYQRTEALELKGDDARLHFGIIAQDLEEAFAAEGLDANRYAMFLEDTWYVTEEDGEIYPVLEAVPEELREDAIQKSLKGIRYEQLLAFIIAAI
jgi:hypothetical protein